MTVEYEELMLLKAIYKVVHVSHGEQIKTAKL